ncbi:MAG TPA: DUF2079 domain-containing protein [Candidatus Woesebacteria bacterium]|nr:DUF2079 domain-containing protein [Candidatus Woesebacteria bacterium]
MISRLKKYLPEILLALAVVVYAIYFSLLTINRFEKLYSHYFDLGIMDQTVHNTYKGLVTGNFSRILELTNPHISAEQVKRMSIHNDIFLALLSPFYIIHDGPETLLVIQTIVVAIGAVFIFLLGKKIFEKIPYGIWLSVLFAIAYLLYPPLQKANKYDFHAVTLATTLLLGMFYYWKSQQYKISIVFAVLALITKEQVGMTVAVFGAYILYEQYIHHHFKSQNLFQTILHFFKKLFKIDSTVKEKQFAYWIIGISMIWILLSMLVIIPASRGKEHFASHYYNHIKENPFIIATYPFRGSTLTYLQELLSPVGFLSVFSPIQLFIATPELGVNLLSSNSNMRNTYFHYTSVITPFVFISSMYGAVFLYTLFTKRYKKRTKLTVLCIGIYLSITTLISAYFAGPLPFAKTADIIPWKEPQVQYYDVIAWEKILEDDQIKVSTTGRIAPHFTTRQYFYDFSWKYKYADYIILETHDALYGYLKGRSVPAYNELQKDKNYIKIYDMNGIEVYRKLSNYE